jgi:integrase/recombinase XerC
VNFKTAIDQFISDMRAEGRLNSDASVDGYLYALRCHAEDVGNRSPHDTNRDDVRKTLARWKHPNSQRKMRAILVSFYRWAMEEGHRKDNPAEQTRRPKPRPTTVYRLTHQESVDLMNAAQGYRERRVIFIGICAGLRNAELRGLRGKHFARDGAIWISADIAKGKRERWVPVIADLEPIVKDIRENVGPEEFVLPAQRWRDPSINRDKVDLKLQPCSAQAVYYLVKRVGKRAGIAADLHPHLLRHAFADHIARFAGVRNAQFLLGHAGLGTTETYLGRPSLDELTGAVLGFSFGALVPPGGERTLPPLLGLASNAVKATTGIEPVGSSSSGVERKTLAELTFTPGPVVFA